MQTVLKIDGVIPSFASEGYDTPVMMSSLCDVSLTSQKLMLGLQGILSPLCVHMNGLHHLVPACSPPSDAHTATNSKSPFNAGTPVCTALWCHWADSHGQTCIDRTISLDRSKAHSLSVL